MDSSDKMNEQPQECNWLNGNPFEAMEAEAERRKREQPQEWACTCDASEAPCKIHGKLRAEMLEAQRNDARKQLKLLVDALELVRRKIRIHTVTITERVATATQIIDDALAKVKEGK